MVDWVAEPPRRGLDVKTTIDVDIQDITEQALLQTIEETQPEFAVAIVMEVATGDIKAMSNLSRLPGGEYVETVNNAVQGYEPGSVVKPLSMMIALDDGVVRPHDVVNGHDGVFRYPAGMKVRPITDTHGRASMTATEAMKYSSNIGLSEIILRGYERNPDEFVQRIYKSGFMEPFDLCIPGAARPTIRHLKSTVQDRINLTRMSYGYTTKIPPIYTLALYNTIANDGQFVKPRLVKELIRDGVTDTVFDISYSMGRLDVPMDIPSDSRSVRSPAILKGDIAETRQVLQHLGVRGDVTQCRDMEAYCDSMPDVCGMGARDALYILEREGLNVNIQGRGKVVEQSIPSGKVIQPGTTVILKLK